MGPRMGAGRPCFCPVEGPAWWAGSLRLAAHGPCCPRPRVAWAAPTLRTPGPLLLGLGSVTTALKLGCPSCCLATAQGRSRLLGATALTRPLLCGV